MPRTWYYFLKHIDPDCHTFKYIVIGLRSYWDDDWPDSEVDNIFNAYTLLPILSMRDAGDLLSSYSNFWIRLEATLACLLKMYGYRSDISSLFAQPFARFDILRDRANWLVEDYEYQGNPNSLAGVKVVEGKVVGPISESSRESLQNWLNRPAPESGFQPLYLSFWLNRILDRYKGTSTKIFLIHIPDAPLPKQTKYRHLDRTIKMISSRPNVIVDPENDFDALCEPRFFYDARHMNKDGRKLFTCLLTKRILDIARDTESQEGPQKEK
jgi:hypothetical protein